MAKIRSTFVCQQCGYISPSFLGRCPECNTWNSLVEQIQEPESRIKNKELRKKAEIVNLKDVDKKDYTRVDTTIGEFNRVLGGGIVLGSVVLVFGDPGIGKSTVLTQLALNVEKTLYVAGEESAHQIKLRSERINKGGSFPVLSEVDVDVITSAIKEFKPKLAIIDSIQTLETQDLTSASGSVGQVRECAHRLQRVAKETHIPIFIVGHVTKEGTVAGPKTLEHLVDVVLSLEGDENSNLRVMRASKNRFGPTDEVGIFEMEESGLRELVNPSESFLEHKVNAPGSVVISTMNGYRPLLIEIQALVTKSYAPIPRRVGNGIDNNRLNLLVAVLSKRLGLSLFDQDVFVNVTGGLKINEPAADLGICLAVASSLKDKTIDAKTVLIGEVGLLGEIRPVRQLEKRVNEAKKLGFTKAISPESAKSLAVALKLALQE